jgi:hypothetical protein
VENPTTMLSWLDQEYPPSFYERFTARIDRLTVPSWLVYTLIPLLWLLLVLLAQSIDGQARLLAWEPINFVAIFQIGYVLFINQFLDKHTLRALDEIKPTLRIQEDQYPKLQYLISTLPTRKTILFCLLFGMVGVLLSLGAMVGTNLDTSIALGTDLSGIVVLFTLINLWITNGLIVYHTFHQLNVVSFIYTHLVIVRPFQLRELFAFSGFSARTGIAIVLITPLWIIFDPGLVSLAISMVFALFGLIAFLSPLLGVHDILVREKDRLLDENAKQVERAI